MDWEGLSREISAVLLASTSQVTDQTGSLSAAERDVIEEGVSSMTLC